MNRRCALRLHYDACHEVSVRLRGTKQVRSQLAQELMPVPRCRDTTPRDSQGIRRADEPRPTRGTVRTLRRRRISGELAVSVTDEKPRSDADRQRTRSTSTGPGEGGAPVEIIGRGLARRPLSTLETRRRQAIPPLSSYAVVATAPAGTSTVDVTVTTAGGTSATSNADRYTYASSAPNSDAPTISSLAPASGPLVGGTRVTITGSRLDASSPSPSVAFRP